MGLGEADRADIRWGKSYGLGEYFQPQAGHPGATQGPPKSNLEILIFIKMSFCASGFEIDWAPLGSERLRLGCYFVA